MVLREKALKTFNAEIKLPAVLPRWLWGGRPLAKHPSLTNLIYKDKSKSKDQRENLATKDTAATLLAPVPSDGVLAADGSALVMDGSATVFSMAAAPTHAPPLLQRGHRGSIDALAAWRDHGDDGNSAMAELAATAAARSRRPWDDPATHRLTYTDMLFPLNPLAPVPSPALKALDTSLLQVDTTLLHVGKRPVSRLALSLALEGTESLE